MVRPSPLTGEEKAFRSHVRHFLSIWVALTAVASVPWSPVSRLPGARHHWGSLAQLHKEKCEKFHFEAGRFGIFFQIFRFLFIYFSFFHCESGQAQEQVAQGGSSFPPRASPGFSTSCLGSPCPGMCPAAGAVCGQSWQGTAAPSPPGVGAVLGTAWEDPKSFWAA